MRYGLYVRKSSEDSSKQVQSIENQLQILQEKAKKENLTILKIYQESRSAKEPYKREQFNQMLIDLQDGVIEGIICWKLDRLSRNPIDGGSIQHFLLKNIIKEIVTFEKTYYPSDNSIMMTVELGIAVEFSQSLSKNVKRGQNFKVQKGHYPNTAPIGYRNTTIEKSKGERTIELDEDRFNLVRQLWDLHLTGNYSNHDLAKRAEAMGLRTKQTKNFPERKISRHGIYTILTNPFYYGEFMWGQNLYPGNHQPIITKEEFEKAQKILRNRKQAPRPKKHFYAFKGALKCGECGASITAEHKGKRRKNGTVNSRIYYRCTHRIKDSECKQLSVREEDLERQFLEILDSITIPAGFAQWAAKWLYSQSEENTIKQKSIREQQRKHLDKLDDQIQVLLEMRLNKEIDPLIFTSKNESLLIEKRTIEKEMSLSTDTQEESIKKTLEVFEICQKIQAELQAGTLEQKKIILDVLGSQFYLKDQKLTVGLAKPFQLIKDAVSDKWVLDPRFATLKSKSEPGLSDSDLLLIENGGDEGT